jgi:hypothetical protein
MRAENATASAVNGAGGPNEFFDNRSRAAGDPEDQTRSRHGGHATEEGSPLYKVASSNISGQRSFRRSIMCHLQFLFIAIYPDKWDCWLLW